MRSCSRQSSSSTSLRRKLETGPPLLVLAIFRKRAFSVELGVSFLFNIAVSGYVLFFTLMVQIGLGYNVLRAGMYNAPLALAVFLSLGLVGRRLMPLLGRRMIPAGAALMLIGMVPMAALLPAAPPDQDYALHIAIPQLIAGVGLGAVLTAMSPIILSNVDARPAGLSLARAELRRSSTSSAARS